MQQQAWTAKQQKLQVQGVLTELDVIEIDNPFCSAVIALQGAQVLHYQQKAKSSELPIPPLLWLSDNNSFAPQKAIRGGIPLCFPWFNKHPEYPNLASHGFARNLEWILESIIESADGHQVVLTLEQNMETLKVWPYSFKAQLAVHLGEQLSLRFSVKNTDKQAFEFKFLFHSYFAVDDIHQTQVMGLENTAFLDHLNPELDNLREVDTIGFNAETDRLYSLASGRYRIMQPSQSDILIQSDCSDAVVWNPWIEKTQRLGDMSADAWQQMLCVECGQVSDPVMLAVGETRAFKMFCFRP